MIALCRQHHPEADAGTYTVDQLRSFKDEARSQRLSVEGRFNWLRLDLVPVVGSNAYPGLVNILQVYGRPCVWFTRDDDDHLLLNVDYTLGLDLERVQIAENYWTASGEPIDLQCPPSGKLIEVKYDNNDYLRVEYLEMVSVQVPRAA